MPYKDRNKHKRYQNDWLKRKRKKARDAGKCKACFGQPRYGKLTTCLECSYKRFAREHLSDASRWQELRDLLLRQKHRCAYTGIPIDIGSHASIEHVEPVSKNARRATDITNLKWVHREVNSMKRDMGLHEFIMMCKSVLSYFGYEVGRDESR